MSIERILILCGDRNWTDRRPIAAFITTLPSGLGTVVITGGASGADTIGCDLSRDAGHRSIRMDAPWRFYGKRAGPIRNQWMLDVLQALVNAHPAAVADVHAFHDHISSSKGTADMLARARKAGVPYTIHTSGEPEPEATLL